MVFLASLKLQLVPVKHLEWKEILHVENAFHELPIATHGGQLRYNIL